MELWQWSYVAKLSVKTEVSQTTPLHTRNFWKHSGTFQDKILGHFRAWGGAKGAQSVLKRLLLMVFFWRSTMCTCVGGTLEGSSGIVNLFFVFIQVFIQCLLFMWHCDKFWMWQEKIRVSWVNRVCNHSSAVLDSLNLVIFLFLFLATHEWNQIVRRNHLFPSIFRLRVSGT